MPKGGDDIADINHLHRNVASGAKIMAFFFAVFDDVANRDTGVTKGGAAFVALEVGCLVAVEAAGLHLYSFSPVNNWLQGCSPVNALVLK